MLKRTAVRHFRDVFHWSADGRIEIAEALAAAFGMAGPVLAGVVAGHEAAGFAASLGGLAVGRVEAGTSIRDHIGREVGAPVPVVLVAAVAIALAGAGIPAAMALIAIPVVAALIGGLSRPMAVASTRFVIFLMIVSALPGLSTHQGVGLPVLIALGAAWTSVLGLSLATLANTTSRAGTRRPIAPSCSSSASSDLLFGYRTIEAWRAVIREEIFLLVRQCRTLARRGHIPAL